MTHQAPPTAGQPGGLPGSDPGRQIASLREALLLVRSICGDGDAMSAEARLDEGAAISAAYDVAPPIVQRRFDAMAGEVAAWAAAGVEALLASGDAPPPGPARRLAEELDEALRRLIRMLL